MRGAAREWRESTRGVDKRHDRRRFCAHMACGCGTRRSGGWSPAAPGESAGAGRAVREPRRQTERPHRARRIEQPKKQRAAAAARRARTLAPSSTPASTWRCRSITTLPPVAGRLVPAPHARRRLHRGRRRATASPAASGRATGASAAKANMPAPIAATTPRTPSPSASSTVAAPRTGERAHVDALAARSARLRTVDHAIATRPVRSELGHDVELQIVRFG